MRIPAQFAKFEPVKIQSVCRNLTLDTKQKLRSTVCDTSAKEAAVLYKVHLCFQEEVPHEQQTIYLEAEEANRSPAGRQYPQLCRFSALQRKQYESGDAQAICSHLDLESISNAGAITIASVCADFHQMCKPAGKRFSLQ